MRIAIVSIKKTLYSTKNITTIAEQKGHEVVFVNPIKCNLILGENGPTVYYKNKILTNIDLVLTRIGYVIADYGLSLVRHLEKICPNVINSSCGIYNAVDKMRCLQLLTAAKIPIPRTFVTLESGNLPEAVKMVGGVPVIIKPLYGSQGKGIILAESMAAVNSIAETLWGLRQTFLIQEYIAEAKGADIRAFVIGNKVVASMRRKARKNDFRSNIHRGGKCEKVELPENTKKTAVNAAKTLKLEIAGVDMMETSKGYLIVEVNSSPGFEALEKITGVNIGETIVDYAVSCAKKTP